jgi:hypothetical protein
MLDVIRPRWTNMFIKHQSNDKVKLCISRNLRPSLYISIEEAKGFV